MRAKTPVTCRVTVTDFIDVYTSAIRGTTVIEVVVTRIWSAGARRRALLYSCLNARRRIVWMRCAHGTNTIPATPTMGATHRMRSMRKALHCSMQCRALMDYACSISTTMSPYDVNHSRVI
jgi:hypothetical protein